ncbi:MAG TPA: alpha/beta fold hydrolase [Gemmataceae bacterium]|nr:alpha/beta fold hydrolase [Gemmataceae bacterium]
MDINYLRDHAETRGFLLGRPVRAKPTPDGKAVLFLRSQARVPKLSLYEFDTTTGQTRQLLTPEQLLQGAEEKLSPEEKARRERQRVSVGGFTDFQLSDDGSLILLSLSGKLYVVRRATGQVTELKTGAGTLLDPKFSPDGKRVAYVRDYDLYVYDLTADQERRLTTGGSATKTHGLAEFVAQEEMHRHSGYWWSPDSKFLVYEEADAAGVEVWYVADPIRPEQPPHPSFYPRPGKANVKVRLGVIPVTGGETVWIDWDAKKYEYLTQVRWEKHGPLTLTVQTRDQKELVLLKADPATGKTTPLAVEKDPAWVNLHQSVPRWLAGGKGFLWLSEAGGRPRLQLRDPEGNLVRDLVTADLGPEALVDADPESGQVIVAAGTDPTQSYLYRVALAEGKPVPLAAELGLHSASFAKDHSIYVRTTTTPSLMPRSTVHQADGTLVGELPSVAENPPFTPKVEFYEVGEGDGFYTAVVRPHDFDPKKRYPVIVDVYGGPGHVHVVKAMRNWLLDQWLADQGFIVVAIDNRGTPGRGRDWERALYQKFGSVPLDDQIAGLQALGRKFPEMDLERVGVVGWSFGGYLAALAVLKRPDVFKAAVAGAPVVDWEDYDTHYTERYLGLPDADREAYREASLLTYAAGLSRPLLLVHGTADDNVYFRHTLKLADALFRAGKEFELLPLSGLTHMVPDPVVTQRLWSRIAGHFQKHLGKPRG